MWKPRGDTRVPDPLPCTHAHTHARAHARLFTFAGPPSPPWQETRATLCLPGRSNPYSGALALAQVVLAATLPQPRTRPCLPRQVNQARAARGWLSRKTLQRKRGSGCASPPLSPLRTPTLSLGHGSREASPTLGQSGVPPSPDGNHGVLLCYTGGTASAPPPHARFESGHGAWQSVRVERASYPHGRTRCFSPRHSAHSLFLRFPARAPTAPLPQPTPPHPRPYVAGAIHMDPPLVLNRIT